MQIEESIQNMNEAFDEILGYSSNLTSLIDTQLSSTEEINASIQEVRSFSEILLRQTSSFTE